MTGPIMRAQWLDLLIASYRVDRALLEPLVPEGLELLTWKGEAYVSLVAFDFKRVRMWGLPIPGQTDFPEWNLRFYVREMNGEHRKGVVFIRELVPKRLVTLGARWLYNEPYETWPMTSSVLATHGGKQIRHSLSHRTGDMSISYNTSDQPRTPDELSEAHFFKEHSWGFGTSRAGKTRVYRVAHPVWSTREVSDLTISINGTALYGEPWDFVGAREPDSVVFAEGSDIEVYPGDAL